MSNLTDRNLLPGTQYDESNVLNWYKLDGTGMAGQLVTIQAGGQDPANSAGAYSTSAPNGYALTNIGNYRYGTSRAVRPCAVDDHKFQILGITLATTALNDENGNLLVNQPYDKTLERGYVQTGFATPILTRGVVTLKWNQIGGTALPGYIGIAGAAGTITAVNPTAANRIVTITGGYDVGKFLSSSGSAFGGYYQFMVTL